MNIKRTIIKITMILFMVFAISSVTEYSYAYWASNLGVGTADYNSATVTTGTWAPAWDANTTYVSGDQVFHNGTTYQAKKDNPTKEPGVDGGWNSQWAVIA